jgi:hypothetical protein
MEMEFRWGLFKKKTRTYKSSIWTEVIRILKMNENKGILEKF